MTHKPSLESRTLPAWYDNAKFGIFIHWSASSIPAYAPPDGPIGWANDPQAWVENPDSSQYLKSMLFPGSSTARYHAGHHGDISFDDLVEQFRAGMDRWDPEPWAELVERAGARYVVLASKLEDGFVLWPSEHRNPRKPNYKADRDVVGELAAAVRARGIRFGTYCSGLDWTISAQPPPPTDMQSLVASMPEGEESIRYLRAHWAELIERYRPSLLWADYGFPAEGNWEELFEWYLARVPDGVINNRFDDPRLEHRVLLGQPARGEQSLHHDFTTPQSVLASGRDYGDLPTDKKWEACRAMAISWTYNRQETEEHYPSPTELLHELIETVAHGGNFILNVSPTSTAELPWMQVRRLLEIGWWLGRSGGAIYGTRRWVRPTGTTGEGLKVCYTASSDAVHAIVLGTPTEARVELDVRLDLGAEVRRVDGSNPLPWTSTDHGVVLRLPEIPPEQPAIALRLTPRSAVRGS